jgi:hypothetical protein
LVPRLLAAASASFALANHAAFFLSDHRHDPNGESVSVRHIGRNEVDAGLLQPVTRRARFVVDVSEHAWFL